MDLERSQSRQKALQDGRMLEMLRDLVGHKGHANAAVLSAISQKTPRGPDAELLALLHHVLVQTGFGCSPLSVCRSRLARRPPLARSALLGRYQAYRKESAWFATATAADTRRGY